MDEVPDAFLGLPELHRYAAWLDGMERGVSVWGMENDAALQFQAIHRGYRRHVPAGGLGDTRTPEE